MLIRRKVPQVEESFVLGLLEQAGQRGLTAREAAKLTPGKPDPHQAGICRALFAIHAKGITRTEWSPCEKDHYAVQEGRYWIKEKPKPLMIVRKKK